MSRTPRSAAPLTTRLRSSWYGTSLSRIVLLVVMAVLAALALRAGGTWLANLVAVVRGAQP